MLSNAVSLPGSSAVLYVRVSTAQQSEEGVSLEAQLHECRAYAVRQRLTVAGEFQDAGLSGKLDVEDRPGLSAALQAVRVSRGILVVYSLSRLARSQRVLWNMIDCNGGMGVSIASATEPFESATPLGKALLGMLSVWSSLEADMISARTSTALRELQRRGVRLGAPSMTESRIGGSIQSDPEKLLLLRFVQNLSRPGISQREVVGYLNTAGVRSPLGKRWHQRSLQVALKLDLPESTERAPTLEEIPARFRIANVVEVEAEEMSEELASLST